MQRLIIPFRTLEDIRSGIAVLLKDMVIEMLDDGDVIFLFGLIGKICGR